MRTGSEGTYIHFYLLFSVTVGDPTPAPHQLRQGGQEVRSHHHRGSHKEAQQILGHVTRYLQPTLVGCVDVRELRVGNPSPYYGHGGRAY